MPPSSEGEGGLLRCGLPECGQLFSSTRAGQKFCRPEHREQHRRSRLEARADAAVESQTDDGPAAGGHAVWNGDAWSLEGFEVLTAAIPDPPLPQPKVFSTPKGTYAQLGRAGSSLAVGPVLSLAEPVAVLPGDTDTSRAAAHGAVGGGIISGQDADVAPALRSDAPGRARSAASTQRATRGSVGALVTGSRYRPRAIAVGLAVATFGFGLWGFIPAPDAPAAVQEAVAPPAATEKVTPAAWVSQARSALAATQAQLDTVNAALSEWEGAATGGAVRRQPPQVAQLYAQRDRLVAQQTLLQNELADADALPSDTAALAALQARLGQITAALAGPAGAGQQAANTDALTAQRDWLTAQITALQNQVGSLTQSVAGAQHTPLPDLTDTSTPTALAVSDLAHDPLQDPWIGSQDVAPSPLSDPQYPSSPARVDATTSAPPGGDQSQGPQGGDHGGVITDVGDATQALFGGDHGNHGDNGRDNANNTASGNGETGGGSSSTPVSLPGATEPDPAAPTGPGTGNGAGSTGPTTPAGPPGGRWGIVGVGPVGTGPGQYKGPPGTDNGPPTPGYPLPVDFPGVPWTLFGELPVIVDGPLPVPAPPVVVDPIVVPAAPAAVTPPPGSITLVAAETSTATSVPAVVSPAPVATAATTSPAPAASTSPPTARKSATPSASSSPSKTKKPSSKASSSSKAKKSPTSTATSAASKAAKSPPSKSKASASKSTKSASSKGGTAK